MKKRRRRTMFWNLTLAFMLIGLLPMVVIGSLFVLRYSSNMTEVVAENAFTQAVYISRNIEREIDDLDLILRHVYDYKSESNGSFMDIVTNEDLSGGERSRQIKTALSELLYMDDEIESVRFIDNDKRLYNVNRDVTLQVHGKVMLADGISREVESEVKDLYYFSTFSADEYYKNYQQMIFSLARYCMDISTIYNANNKVLGSVYVDINVNKLVSLIEEISIHTEGNTYIIDKDTGQYIYSKQEDDFGDVFPEKEIAVDALKRTYINRDGFLYISRNIEGSPWILVTRINQDDIFAQYRANILFFILFLIVASIFLIIVNLIYSRKISGPARELKMVMTEIEKGNLDVYIENEWNDEMGFLAEGLNHMVSNLKEYIDKVYIAQLQQKEAQLDALLTQISPHYLYNTLDVIRMTALSNHDEQAAMMLGSLSSQLRYMIGDKSRMVSLRREIENIREYFVLVKVRFQDMTELAIEVNKEVMELQVMKLMLQPIVENAVKHGFKGRKGKGCIRLKATRHKTYLEIVIMDDGVGMSEEQIIEMNESFESENLSYRRDEGTGIGLKNVAQRIRKNWGPDYGLEVTSCINLGTIVKVRLPIVEERDMLDEALDQAE